MSSYSPQNSNQDQQLPFADNTNANGHMVLLAILAVILFFILISFRLYVRYRRRNHVIITIQRGRRTPPIAATTGGLDAIAIASLPTFINRVGSSTNECAEECAVCLSVAEDGETMRLLPDCKHVFHIECIDMWLHSHSTCPVCRTRVKTATMFELPLPGRAAQEGGFESSQVSRMGNGSRRWASTVDDGVMDLERQ